MKYILCLLCSIMLVSSCSKYQKLVKSSDMEAKYKAAVNYYDKKDYYHALQLFEELITVFRGTARAEQSYYYYAFCTYNVDDYPMAAYQFNNFVSSYPNSKYAEEMQFMYAFCFYKDSPTSSLDQTNTLDAIEKFQLFTNKFPKSDRVAEANKLIDELRMKLERKAFDNARLYYRTENYKAAIYSFENFLKDFPGSDNKEESLYLSLRSAYLYANNSVEAKKGERFKSTIEQYYKLIDSFPQSRYLRDAERLYEVSRKALGMDKTTSIPSPEPLK